jgi:hypothetical protein
VDSCKVGRPVLPAAFRPFALPAGGTTFGLFFSSRSLAFIRAKLS